MAISDLNALVIDDQESMRSIIRNLLAVVGIKKVQEAGNIDAATQLLLTAPQETRPNFIITDLYMDKGGGIDFIARLKTHPDLKEMHIPVVLLTGETNSDVLNKALGAGASQIVGKPCSAQELGRAIGKALGVCGAHASKPND